MKFQLENLRKLENTFEVLNYILYFLQIFSVEVIVWNSDCITLAILDFGNDPSLSGTRCRSGIIHGPLLRVLSVILSRVVSSTSTLAILLSTQEFVI